MKTAAEECTPGVPRKISITIPSINASNSNMILGVVKGSNKMNSI
jgi:6-phosphogluconolactonase/glucosamine-6-phosphate isomerase/deaminase